MKNFLKVFASVYNVVFMFPKLVYLSGAFINVLMMNVVKYIGLNGILSVNEMIMTRAFFAILILLPFNWKELKSLKNESKKTNLMILALGLISVLDTYTWYQGLQTVPLNNAMILLFLSPIITAVMSTIILKEKITFDIILKFIINISAIFLIYHFSIGKLTIGYFYLMSDFVIYGIIAILIKKLDKFSANFLVFIRLVIILPISAIIAHKLPTINIKVVIFIAIVVFGYIIERSFITYAFKTAKVVEIQPLRYFNIVFSSILSYLILDERTTVWQFIGVSIIIFGTIIIDSLKKIITKK